MSADYVELDESTAVERSFAAPPAFGDARSAQRYQDELDRAVETKRLARIATFVAPRGRVQVGARVFAACEPISLGDVQDAEFWLLALRKGAIVQIKPEFLAQWCEHGPTHIVISEKGTQGHQFGDRVCWRCFDKAAVREAAEVPAQLDWMGRVRQIGSPAVVGVPAVDGRKVIEDYERRGKLRRLQSR